MTVKPRGNGNGIEPDPSGTGAPTRFDYTPAKVELLLRRLPYLLDRQRPPELRDGRRQQQTSPGGWIEDQMAMRADIEMALARLPQPTYRIVYLSYVGGKSLREVGSVVKVSHETVRRHRVDGIKLMAWHLGWRDPEGGYP